MGYAFYRVQSVTSWMPPLRDSMIRQKKELLKRLGEEWVTIPACRSIGP